VVKRAPNHITTDRLLAGVLLAATCFLSAPGWGEDTSDTAPVIDALTSLPATTRHRLASTLGLGSLHGKVKIANNSDLTLQILPSPEFRAGSKIGFTVTSKRPGYLILIDIDGTGKMTQIYPNPISLLHAQGMRERSNFLKPSRPLRIPDPDNAYAGFEFVATPSGGPSMVVAMLSQRAVQLIDLPDLPESVTDFADALTYLASIAADLKVPAGQNGALSDTEWSFDASAYWVKTD
jgi:hypothetical protein